MRQKVAKKLKRIAERDTIGTPQLRTKALYAQMKRLYKMRAIKIDWKTGFITKK